MLDNPFGVICACALALIWWDVLFGKRTGHWFALVFNSIYRALAGTWEFMKKPLDPKRTPVQKRFNTDLTWGQVRWKIAAAEHELFAEDDWTHEKRDCVHELCDTEALRRLVNGNIIEFPPPHTYMGPMPSEPRSSMFRCARCNTTWTFYKTFNNLECPNCDLLPNPGRVEKR